MPPDQALTLECAGRAYGGWKSVRVRRSMEQCSGSFQLEVSELVPGQDTTQLIRAGDACRVLIGKLPVITGWVDAVQIELDKTQHTVVIGGRDATADLVDCSAIRKTGQWRGQKVERIAADLCEPFKVRVQADVDTGAALANFALQEGETAFEAIERAARVRALLVMSTGNGELLLTRAGLRRSPTDLVLGKNLLSARGTLDLRDRFSQYICKGQAPGTDLVHGTQVSQMKATAADVGVTRYRPFILHGEAADVNASLRQRVDWERNVRLARSTQFDLKVHGWSHAQGPWLPNTLVRVNAPALRVVDEDLLISAVDFSLDERGTTTDLTLTRADAFSLLPMKEQKGRGPWWSLPKAGGAK